MARREGRLDRHRSAAVPGADVLADVAAEDVRADAGAMLLRNRAAQLDREVGDAERRVEPLPGHDGRGRAGVDAARAGAAAVGRRRVRRDVERHQQFAQEEPRAQLLVDQAGIPADPAQAGKARVARSSSGAVSTQIFDSNGRRPARAASRPGAPGRGAGRRDSRRPRRSARSRLGPRSTNRGGCGRASGRACRRR